MAVEAKLAPRLLLPLYERATGWRLRSELLRLRELQWRPAEELEARALEKLRPLLAHAQARVPYYRELFRKVGLEAGEVRRIADLSRLPITTKADLRARFPGEVVAENLPKRRRRRGNTAGSTGFPFQFYTDRAGSAAWLGSYLFFREWAGAPLGDTMVYIPRPAHTAPRDARVAALKDLGRRLLIGERTVHLSDFEPDAEELSARLRRLPPGSRYFIWGFPSYIARVAAQLLESGKELPWYPGVVITYAETLSLLNAAAIQRAFRCAVVNHYSSWEVLHLAQTCPDNPEVLHVNSERAILRVVGPDGNPTTGGQAGRVVITDLANYVMPFINYEIGDWAIAGPPCRCGRGFPSLLSIEGRLGELIRTPAGRVVLPIEVCRFLNIVARAHPYIWEYQAVQTALDRVVVSIVPTAQFSAAFADKLAAELETFLGPDLRVQVEAVQQIPREPSGKRLLVKSRLDLN
jgi:phenylacetate-CoA ligase